MKTKQFLGKKIMVKLKDEYNYIGPFLVESVTDEKMLVGIPIENIQNIELDPSPEDKYDSLKELGYTR